MTSRKQELPEFLSELEALEGKSGLDALAQAASPPAIDPPADGRGRLLSSLSRGGRLWRFAEQVADLLDLPIERARELLDDVDRSEVWEPALPGITRYWVEGGPRVRGAVRGFIRVDAGLTFPEHAHLGPESVLILQGSYRDTVDGQIYHPGDVSVMTEGSEHAVEVPGDGIDLLKLVVAYNGVRIGDTVFGPRD
jgi:quercetin dioxygenase-like cupin family protein